MNCCLHLRYQAFEKIPKDSVLFRTLQTKVNARGKFTYISVEKNSILVSQRLPSNPVGQSHRREPSMLKTRASLARFICARVAHCFTFSTGSVVVQWLTEVQELVIDVNISDAASKMFVEDWEYNW